MISEQAFAVIINNFCKEFGARCEYSPGRRKVLYDKIKYLNREQLDGVLEQGLMELPPGYLPPPQKLLDIAMARFREDTVKRVSNQVECTLCDSTGQISAWNNKDPYHQVDFKCVCSNGQGLSPCFTLWDNKFLDEWTPSHIKLNLDEVHERKERAKTEDSTRDTVDAPRTRGNLVDALPNLQKDDSQLGLL